MSSEAKGRVDSMVKEALKEAMEKRKLSAKTEEVAEVFEEAIETVEKEIEVALTPTKDGQKLLSDILGKDVTSNNFPVTCFFDYNWDEKIAFLIPEIDTNYVLDEKLCRDVLMSWELNDKTLMYGPTGAGKSSLIEQLCARTNRPFLRINCTGDMDSSMIFGQLTAKDGSTHWEDGSVTEAVKYGAVFAWDEWDVTPPEISMGLQWLLEENGKLVLKEKPGAIKDKHIVPHEFFRIVAIGNTQGQGDDTGAHSGTNVQNTATLDRFGTAVYVDYLAADVEEKMLKNKFDKVLSVKATKELVKLANLVRQGYKAGQFNLTISPRTLLNICKKLRAGSSLRQAFTTTYLNKLNDTQRKVADELFVKIYGTSI